MTIEQAREVLRTYRPWSGEPHEADLIEAMAQVPENEELRRWFKDYCATQQVIRDRMKAVPVPPGLMEQIISEHRVVVPLPWWRQPAVLATAACLMLLAAVFSFYRQFAGKAAAKEDITLAGFRARMVTFAIKSYSMDLETNDVTRIKAYLNQHGGDADYQLPERIATTSYTGCGVLSWQGHTVSMICFNSGRQLPPGQKTDLFLFVMTKDAVPNPPRESDLQIAQVSQHATASWSSGDKIYVLSTDGDEAFLRSLLL